MKSNERHDLRRNELAELLSNPRELARRYGLTTLIIIVAAVVAIWFIYRASGAQERKWRRAWSSLQMAESTGNEEQLKGIAADAKAEPLMRAWANTKRGALLYTTSRQSEYSRDKAAGEELLSQAVSCYEQALQIGQKWPEVVGQATVGLALCHEDLGQLEQAIARYESIISQEQTFAGTVWLAQARRRKAFLETLPEEKIVFTP